MIAITMTQDGQLLKPMPSNIQPVNPELKESPLQRRSELAVRVVMKYLEGVAMVYDVDENWVIREIVKRLETKLRD